MATKTPEWLVIAGLRVEPPGPVELHDELVVLCRLEVRSETRRAVNDDDAWSYGAMVKSAEVVPAKGDELELVARLLQRRADERNGTPALPLETPARYVHGVDEMHLHSSPADSQADDVVPSGEADGPGEVAYANPDGTTTRIPVANRVSAGQLATAGVTAAQYLEACELITADQGAPDAERIVMARFGKPALDLVLASLNRAAADADGWEDPAPPPAPPTPAAAPAPKAPRAGRSSRAKRT